MDEFWNAAVTEFLSCGRNEVDELCGLDVVLDCEFVGLVGHFFDVCGRSNVTKESFVVCAELVECWVAVVVGFKVVDCACLRMDGVVGVVELFAER